METIPTSDELLSVLKHHVIDPWFPRCIDTTYGGFLCDFDHIWKPCGPHNKLLEFQARQTSMAAQFLQLFTKDERLHHAMTHGFRFLRDKLWDHQWGGWFHLLKCTGDPLEAHTKHLHGMIYGIKACASVYTTTGESDALALACEAFEWIERFAYDQQNGGYIAFLQQDGTTILDQEGNPLKSRLDTMGVPLGMKDANIHTDLLAGLLSLYKIWPDNRVFKRLNEVVDVVCNRMSTSSGALFYLCQADWQPVPGTMRYGYALQGASHLIDSCRILNREAELTSAAKSLVDCCITYAWDCENSGFYTAGPASEAFELEEHDLVVRRKVWWVQFEGLKALLAVSHTIDNPEPYIALFAKQWNYIKSFLLDEEHEGFNPVGQDSLISECKRANIEHIAFKFNVKRFIWSSIKHYTSSQRHKDFSSVRQNILTAEYKKSNLESISFKLNSKGSIWKDCSHEGDVLIYCIKNMDKH